MRFIPSRFSATVVRVLTALFVALLVAACLAESPRPKPTETFQAYRVRLFDGQTLDGWDYDDQAWRVEDGAIVGEIPPGTTLHRNTWIIWKGGDLSDFDLRLQFKLSGAPAANSGIQIRAQAKDPSHVSGYQADLDMGATWLGRIYDEHGRALLVERGQRVWINPQGRTRAETFSPPELFAPIFRENDWNDYRIVAIGERMAVFVNGTLFSELVDKADGEKDLSGQLAMQLHSGPETRIEFRNITLEHLAAHDGRLGKLVMPAAANDADVPSGEDKGDLPKDADGKPLNLDFETGDLAGWAATGDAFQGQPVSKDNIATRWRGQASNKQGRYFIGGYEVTHSDAAQGTLTSPWFKVTAPYASFLIAGGAKPAIRVDVMAKDQGQAAVVVATASGDQKEQMRRVVVDLRPYQGQQVAVRLVDESSGGWGHLNFDDFRLHRSRPRGALVKEVSPTHNPLLHHLVANAPPGKVPGETLSKMSVPRGFVVEAIATEPDVRQPMAFTFDPRGRLWVVEGNSYPKKRPVGEGLDRILLFEDADHDGSFESRKVFTEGLNLVSGMQVGHGGVWLGAAPELLFIPDADGDDIPDGEPQVLLDGFGYGDTHETLNNFIWGPDGWLYGNQGVFNGSLVGRPDTPEENRTALAAGVWRYHPTRHEFEVFAHGGSNQWGLDFDDHGQLFMTHCRSFYGKGSTTHVIQGGHFWNQINAQYAPFILAHPVSNLASANYLLASARYGHGEGGAGKPGSRALYGGHSHVGTMVYLGDNWPAEYRNHLFTHNLHGHRINHQVNVREGSSFNTVHAGYDVLHCADDRYVAVDLQCGPDGAVYISDWYDIQHCHNPNTEQWQRHNGRLYRMRFGDCEPAAVDYLSATDRELVDAQLHANDWHVRAARLVLAERASQRLIEQQAVGRLVQFATTHESVGRRLRALWCLHVIGAIDEELAKELLTDDSELVRAWTVQVLSESDRVAGRDALLETLLPKEASPVVKLYLASAAGRLQNQTAWRILEQLVSQPEIANDIKLCALIWQILAQLMPDNLPLASKLVEQAKIPSMREYFGWYAPQVSREGLELTMRRVANARGKQRSDLLKLAAAGLKDSRNLDPLEIWTQLSRDLYADVATRESAEVLGAAFRDASLYARMRQQLSDTASTVAEKRHALSILSTDARAENLPSLLQGLDVRELRPEIIRQLKMYDDRRVALVLIPRLASGSTAERESILETLCSRASSAKSLLDAIDAGTVRKEFITSFHARQMASLRSPDIDAQLERQWGTLSNSSEAKRATVSQLVQAYSQAPKWAYSRSAGAKHFEKLCATCHQDQENAARIGPKLDGTGAKGIEYIVENIVDPNAVIGKDFQARLLVMEDGRSMTGVILKETDGSLTVRTATATEVIAREDIEAISVSPNSFMPEGLIDQLNDRERIELLLYLMSL